MGEPIVRVRDLRLRRGDFELGVPSWDVAPGEVVGVVGPNGAGKTTLLETLPGLLKPDAGSVRVFGMDPVVDPVAVRSRLGFAAMHIPVFDVRVGELLRIVSGYYATWDAELSGSLLTRFGLDEKKRTSQLSTGQAMWLRLLLAFAFRPKLLVLDEPTSGLDLNGRRQLMELLLAFVEPGDCAVVLSSHRLGDVERLSERLLVIHEGAVVRQGRTDELVGDERTLGEALAAWGAL